MVREEEAYELRREPTGSRRASRLPRRGEKRCHHLNQNNFADCDPGQRKNSQTRAIQSEASPLAESVSKRSSDSTASHQRTNSSASQESRDISSPETPPSITRVSGGKGTSPPVAEAVGHDLRIAKSPSRAPKTVTISTPPTPPAIKAPEASSPIPKGPAVQGGMSREILKPQSSLPKTDAKMGHQTEKPTYAESLSKPEPAESHQGLENGQREESFVNVDHTQQSTEDQEISETTPAPKVNGIKANGSRKLNSSASQIVSASYAKALKSGMSSDDEQKSQDDDESYPDLDEMGMDEIHHTPTRKPNGGIRWAPWNVPFKRRGQTLVVLMHSMSIVATVSVFFAFCANPFAWPLLLLYLLYVLSSKAATDGSLKFRSEWFRNSYIWHFFADYYPAKLHKTHDLPPTRKYVFGYHPHGIISHGAWAAFATEALGFAEKFPGITNSLLTLESNFRIPFYREYVLGMGVRSVSKESIVNILSKGGPNGEGMGRAVTIVVGGARESLQAHPRTLNLILRERKGFIKLAVRCGADLVPVLAFGENDLYDQLQAHEHPMMHKVQMFILKVWKFTLPFLHGRGIFNYDVGFMPYRRPLNIVVGAPIKVRQSNSVNQEEIDRLHGLYIAELETLWDRYKDEFLPDRKEDMRILP
ncbi:DAGAT-domain-containing protein [Xylariaceae sp. FL1019]|nr:DAGAT-domain-containing protein [Xylariaceae sp. FL1019]